MLIDVYNRLNKIAGARKHTVRQGETLSAIAQMTGTTVDALVEANPEITNRDRIRAGQVIIIPEDSASSPASDSTAASPPVAASHSTADRSEVRSQAPRSDKAKEALFAIQAAENMPVYPYRNVDGSLPRGPLPDLMKVRTGVKGVYNSAIGPLQTTAARVFEWARNNRNGALRSYIIEDPQHWRGLDSWLQHRQAAARLEAAAGKRINYNINRSSSELGVPDFQNLLAKYSVTRAKAAQAGQVDADGKGGRQAARSALTARYRGGAKRDPRATDSASTKSLQRSEHAVDPANPYRLPDRSRAPYIGEYGRYLLTLGTNYAPRHGTPSPDLTDNFFRVVDNAAISEISDRSNGHSISQVVGSWPDPRALNRSTPTAYANTAVDLNNKHRHRRGTAK